MRETASGAPQFGGQWTRAKLNILEKYLDAYTTALKDKPFKLIYIDAFAGAGWIEESDLSGERDEPDRRDFIMGSTERALRVKNRAFDELIFVEKDPERCGQLRHLSRKHDDRSINVVRDDANAFLADLCRDSFRVDRKRTGHVDWRGVLFVDPFGTELAWSTVERIAAVERLDMWLLFPVSAIIRMLPLSRNPEEIDRSWVARLRHVFGNEDWRKLYGPGSQLGLFGTAEESVRASGVDGLRRIYMDQLREVFGSRLLTESRTLRNSRHSPMFDFIFCAGHPRGSDLAKRIAGHIIREM